MRQVPISLVFTVFCALTSSLANAQTPLAAPTPNVAPTPTLVVNQNDPTRHIYQQLAGESVCPPVGEGPCTITFPAITSGVTLIQHVSCRFDLANTGAGAIYIASLGITNEGPTNLVPVFVFGISGNYINATSYGINADTYLTFTKGQTPTFTVGAQFATPQGLFCTLSGYYN